MELLGLTSYVCFAVALVALFVQLRTSFMLLVVTAPLTTVTAFNISDSSVLIYHLAMGNRSSLAGADGSCRARRVRKKPLESLRQVVPNGMRLPQAGTLASKPYHRLACNSLCSCLHGAGAAA